jgi:hypothetical protein
MQYYCNICRIDITKEEFLYSIDKFDLPLCRKHQAIERKKRAQLAQYERQKKIIAEKNFSDIEKVIPTDMTEEQTSGNEKSLTKKVAGTIGRGMVMGIKKLVRYSKKKRQIRKWKDAILRRMKMSQLKKLCFEQKVSIKKTELREDKNGELYWKELNCTKRDLVSRLKNRSSLNTIISFAQRNNIRIKDVLTDREKKMREWELKSLHDKVKKTGSNFLLQLEKAIRKFTPIRHYNKELPYQDTLASVLRERFPSTKIEVSRGSTRPDIVVRGVAIEIKGPTGMKDLQTIADKCLRYPQYYPRGMICVLFNVTVSDQLYTDWLKGMKRDYPEVIVIRI